MNQWRIDLVSQGMKLRSAGLSYPAIAIVLREYHDFDATAGAVRSALRSYGGAAPKHSRTAGLVLGRRP